jgi:hypothetical protein
VNFNDVQAEVADKLSAIDGLRIVPWDADSITPPAVLFAVPTQVTYDVTYSGRFSFTLPIVVLVGRADARSSRQKINEFISVPGARSVKATVDNSDTVTYTTCDAVTVSTVELDIMRVNGVDYRAAIFNTDIQG